MQQIIFEFDTQYGLFADALYLPDDHGLTDEQIQALKQKRLDNWIAFVTNTQNQESFVGFVTLTPSYVASLLNAAGLSSNDTLVDLGCGEADVLIQGARDFGAKGLGIELDEALAATAVERLQSMGLADQISIQVGNVLNADISSATVVYIYLTPEANGQLQPKLQALAPGVRIVSPSNAFTNWEPTQIVESADGIGYVWVVGG